MISIDYLKISLQNWQGEDESRLKTLKLVLGGFSNNYIAKELNFSLKNIESIIAKLFRKSGIITRGQNSHLINPRVKLFVNGLERDWLRYQVEDRSKQMELLSRNQYLTLLLCAAGCSNNAIAEFLCISSKTVESRLNSLFSIFNAVAQLDNSVNHRIRLIVNAVRQNVLTVQAIKYAAQVLNADAWEETLVSREQIKESFLRLQFEPVKPFSFEPTEALSALTGRLASQIGFASHLQGGEQRLAGAVSGVGESFLKPHSRADQQWY